MEREKNLKGAKGREEIWPIIKDGLMVRAQDSYPPRADGSSILLPAALKAAKSGFFIN